MSCIASTPAFETFLRISATSRLGLALTTGFGLGFFSGFGFGFGFGFGSVFFSAFGFFSSSLGFSGLGGFGAFTLGGSIFFFSSSSLARRGGIFSTCTRSGLGKVMNGRVKLMAKANTTQMATMRRKRLSSASDVDQGRVIFDADAAFT
ncbi:MAG TPA: hypothetical protein ENJ65_06010 [Candidatus Tenderia electrophaga]|uniref:Uncharacterized protein n=1 Tax=Candidatus Tenderia electrophaga TaxID=1748243 RepID=A0A832N5V4_9GAMM|nr:hypothetical protein [Candidatus Tenderia electrophaga]